MDDFDKWLDDFHEHYKKSKSWNNIQHYGGNEKDLLGWYIQFKQRQSHEDLVRWTKWLVFATWVLCGITLLLVKFS